jgi:biopolymer transport protein ExbD
MVSAESSVTPNLVPMVDIMFLLLLFLMVGADMQQREREEVHLPIATSAKQEDPNNVEDETNRALVLNVYHNTEGACSAYDVSNMCTEKSHWAIGVKGIDYTEDKASELKAYLEGEVQGERERRGLPAPEAGKPKPPSELKVMVRADKAALYAFVQRAMNSCADAGIYKIEIGAALPAPE